MHLNTVFSSVSEESAAAGAHCGWGEAGPEAGLQWSQNHQGTLQGDPAQDGSQGMYCNINNIPVRSSFGIIFLLISG